MPSTLHSRQHSVAPVIASLDGQSNCDLGATAPHDSPNVLDESGGCVGETPDTVNALLTEVESTATAMDISTGVVAQAAEHPLLTGSPMALVSSAGTARGAGTQPVTVEATEQPAPSGCATASFRPSPSEPNLSRTQTKNFLVYFAFSLVVNTIKSVGLGHFIRCH